MSGLNCPIIAERVEDADGGNREAGKFSISGNARFGHPKTCLGGGDAVKCRIVKNDRSSAWTQRRLSKSYRRLPILYGNLSGAKGLRE